ncbi:hypothetical protein Celaphus_00011131 [Cervus elaphus hippelaphus]|uniref:Uncharacterized protein n=1 Tax=Cervus elaphus hippelaphus TaxID=46360 RepID=A0A212CRP0_CEREH|nr:uncharacterized protein LOC122451823 isoform X2 [Cervus canadensis]OWK08687.1 hypothetical protein Celaphus_00011131 [Cervus elaphus hippelaphus]
MTSWRRILIYRRLGAISVFCVCELALLLVCDAGNRGRHDSSVDFDGFWWAVVYQKDDNYCWGLKAQACCTYEQTAIKQTWLEVEEVNLNP